MSYLLKIIAIILLHTYTVSSSSSTCNTKTEIQSYTYTNENVFLNIRSKALYSDRRIFCFKSSTCGYEENSEMLMWKNPMVNTYARNSTYTFPNIFQIHVPMIPHDTNSCKSGQSTSTQINNIHPLLRIRRASQHMALNKQTQQMCSGTKPTQSRWKFFSLKWATYIYRQF